MASDLCFCPDRMVLLVRDCLLVGMAKGIIFPSSEGLVRLRGPQSVALVGTSSGREGWNKRKMETIKQIETQKTRKNKSRHGKTSSTSTKWADATTRSSTLTNLIWTSFTGITVSTHFSVSSDSSAEEKEDDRVGETLKRKERSKDIEEEWNGAEANDDEGQGGEAKKKKCSKMESNASTESEGAKGAEAAKGSLSKQKMKEECGVANSYNFLLVSFCGSCLSLIVLVYPTFGVSCLNKWCFVGVGFDSSLADFEEDFARRFIET